MIFQAKTKIPVTLESIALADIVLNLFIFFVIAFGVFATFDASQKGTLPIKLTKASHAAAQKVTDPLVITIEKQGIVGLGLGMVQPEKLKESLNRELALRKEKNVIIRADRNIVLNQFVNVLDILRSTHAKSVAIETES